MKTLLVIAITVFLAGCSASDAKPPQHVLEMEGETVKSFDSLAACNQFQDDMIVALTRGKQIVPEMRCR